MFKTFGEFLSEAKEAKGNYVSINGELANEGLDLGTGVFTKEPHVTLIYSKESNKSLKDIQKVIDTFPEKVTAEFDSMEAFDDGDLYALVLKLKSDELIAMNKKLEDAGLKHSYDYQPHMTYAYNLPKDVCERLKKELANRYKGKTFTLSCYNNNYIIKDWATSK